jgi:tol-pal system protein YbgF
VRSKAILLAAILVALWVGGPAREATADVDESPRRLYDRVMQEFIHKDFEAALAGLRFFMELHGSSPLAASAEYWTGECQLRLGRHREALQSFTAVLSRYPDNSKQPAAALKAGLTYARLGRQTESRLMLEHVMRQYPDTPEAEQARKLLRSLS